GSFESLFDQFQIRFRRGDAMLGFFLEGVQHVHDSREANGVDGAIRLTIEIVHDLQNTGAAKSLQGFGVGCLATQLCIPKRTADSPADLLGKPLRSSLLLPTQRTGFGWGASRVGIVFSQRGSYASSGIVSRL